MALDGVITKVESSAEGVRVTLGSRPAQNYMSHDGQVVHDTESIPGQSSLLIVGASFEPHIGDKVWGGAGEATIESGEISFPYLREGYGKLVEAWPKSITQL
jgi:hypothetical protein